MKVPTRDGVKLSGVKPIQCVAVYVSLLCHACLLLSRMFSKPANFKLVSEQLERWLDQPAR